MCRAMLSLVRLVSVMIVALLSAESLYAGDADEKNTTVPVDCRYEHSNAGTTSEFFPSGDVFRPLLADPKQPQFFAQWHVTQFRTENTSANIGSIGVGENFGFYTRRQGCNGWQVSLLTGVFAQFNLDEKNAELINTDFNVGIPLTWRSGNWSARLRFYHQSSHLGDEFLLSRPGFNRVNLTYEEVDAIISYDYKWLRLYGGGGVLVSRDPSTIDRNRLQWGFEARGPFMPTHVFGLLTQPLVLTPVLTADFKSVEEVGWLINTNLLAGFDMSKAGSFRHFRILFNFYHGYFPYGQFFNQQKVQWAGVGAYFMF